MTDKTRVVERLRELLANATPGPWQLQDGCSWRRIGTSFHDGNVLCPSTYSRTDAHPDLTAGKGEDIYANLTLIVEAVNALPALLDTITTLSTPTSGEASEASPLSEGVGDPEAEMFARGFRYGRFTDMDADMAHHWGVLRGHPSPGASDAPERDAIEETLKRLRELLAKATPGPWGHDVRPGTACHVWVPAQRLGIVDGNLAYTDSREDIADLRGDCREDDANLIVEAVNALPGLLEALSLRRPDEEKAS